MSSSEVDVQASSTPGNGQLATVTTSYQVPPVPPPFVPKGTRPFVPPTPTPEPLVLAVLKKRWWLLLICAAAAGLGAYGVAERFGTQSVKVEGTLAYKGLPGVGNSRIFTPPAVETYAVLMDEPTFLGGVGDKLGLDISPLMLEQALDVEASGKLKAITATLQWGEDQVEAQRVLDEILDAFIDHAADWRTELVGDHIKHVERLLLASNARVEDAAKRLRVFQQKMGLNDHVFSQLPATLTAAQTALETAELTKNGLEVQLKTLAELRKNQSREVNAKALEFKRTRLKSAAARYTEGHKEWKKIQDVLKNLDALEPKVGETDPLVWKQTLDRIGKDILAEPDAAAQQELAALHDNFARTDAHKAEIELALLTKTQEIEMLKERLEQKQGKFKEMNDEMRPQTAMEKSLNEELENANAEKSDLEMQLATLKGIEIGRVREFQKMKKATLAPSGITTNHRRLFILTFFALTLVLASPVFGCEYYARRESPADETARKFNLPVLSRGALDDEIVVRRSRRREEELTDDPLRLLALRIQQSVHRPGSVIVFSALDHEESPISLICKLAACFAERDEMVLVLDASGTLEAHRQSLSVLFQGTPHRTPDGEVLDPTLIDLAGSGGGSALQSFGIADYLLLDYLELTDLALPTRHQGVDCIHGGARPFPREGMATRRMTELLEQCRHRYSMILIAGPSAQHHTDLQLLAARADGLLFTVSGDATVLRHGQEVLQDLMELDAPIMGLIG